MLTILLAARLVLSGVFVLAGLTKLADREGSRKALVEFGVPKFLAGPLGVVLPLAELATALALLPIASSWWGGAGALFLLLLFILGISINLARGRTPDCHCFGQLHSAPAGWSTLGRNAMLASVAGLIVWQGRYSPGLSVVAWFGDLTVAQRVGLLGGLAGLSLLVAQAALLMQILRQQGRLLLRIDTVEARLTNGVAIPAPNVPAAPTAGLPVGTRAPGFLLDGLRGHSLTLEALLEEHKSVLLLFTNPNCGPCQSLMPDVAFWQQEYAAVIQIVLVSEGTLEDNRVKSATQGITQILLQNKREVAESYQVYGTPAAVLIRWDGTVASPLAQGADMIRALVAQTVAGIAQASSQLFVPPLPQGGENGRGHGTAARLPAVKVGEPAPPIKLQDLNGKSVALRSFKGTQTMLLFWNPSCGFCKQMLNDLKAWETNPPPGAPKLVVVSTGRVVDNLAMNLRSTVLVDQDYQAGSAFGANGTPMAILLDAKGRIASEVAAGAEAVLSLAVANLDCVQAAPTKSE